MTMSEVLAIFDYWEKYPPPGELLAAVYKAGIFSPSYSPSTIETGPVPDGCLTVEQLRKSLICPENARTLSVP